MSYHIRCGGGYRIVQGGGAGACTGKKSYAYNREKIQKFISWGASRRQAHPLETASDAGARKIDFNISKQGQIVNRSNVEIIKKNNTSSYFLI